MSVEVLERARAAAAIIAPLSAQIEAERRLPAPAVAALVAAGIFKLAVPRALGGGEVDLTTLIAALDEIARADGSAGWCAMIGATSGLMSGLLDPALAREVYGPADAISSGVFAPLGRATVEGSGLRVTGRWPFASGCEHASWRMGGVIIYDGDRPELLPSGAPHVRSVLFRSSEMQIVDTWSVSGLRGTGSHDMVASDLLLPRERCFSIFSSERPPSCELHRMPFFGVLAAGVAAVAIGIARAAVTAFVELARKKQPRGARRTIAERELVQLDVARAEAKVRAGRALLLDAAGEATASVRSDGAASIAARTSLRLAACHAVTEAAAAVDLAYHAAGASSIYASSPLQRHFRDVHVATQHVMVAPTANVLAGRLLLGLDSDVDTL